MPFSLKLSAIATEKLLLADPSAGRNNNIFNQRAQRTIDLLCYRNLTQ
jgi:hypothetical protein